MLLFFAKAYRIGMSKHLLSKISSTIQMMHRCFVFVSSLSDMWYFTLGILSFLFYWSLIFEVTWYHNNFKELQINYLQKLHGIMLEKSFDRLLGSMISHFKLIFFEHILLNAHFNWEYDFDCHKHKNSWTIWLECM